MPYPYEHAGQEPSLAEVLADPVIHAVMRRDGISLDTLTFVVEEARDRLARQNSRLPHAAPVRRPPAGNGQASTYAIA